MNKTFWFLVILINLIVTACVMNNNNDVNKVPQSQSKQEVFLKELTIQNYQNQPFFFVTEFVSEMGGSFSYDAVGKTLTLEIGDDDYYFIFGVPVVEVNGKLLPERYSFEYVENKLSLPVSFLDIIGIDYYISSQTLHFNSIESKEVISQINNNKQALNDINSLTSLMIQLECPIMDAKVDTIPTHLPGAKRVYRNGYHEGMDWYGFSSGVPINRNTKVYAMGDGLVVRADHNYKAYKNVNERNLDLRVAKKNDKTPEYILDRLRGRQVWIQYDNGLQARFAHLDRINDDIKVGNRVNARTSIGFIGNSGTSGEVNKNDSELHLHLDILYLGELFWKHLTTEEVLQVLNTAFNG